MRTAEAIRRLSHPGFLTSALRNAAGAAWSAVSPDEFSKLYRRIRPYTMVTHACLRGLYRAIREIERKRVPGAVVECGMARGGSLALMGLALREEGSSRPLVGFDNFEGMPLPTDADPDVDLARAYVGTCRGELEEVRALFERHGLASCSRIVKGMFQDTLPRMEIGDIALLHVDADWYESVRCCLEHLYPKVRPGGVIQFDDYGYWQGARKAVDEFLARLANPPSLEVIDYTGRRMIKPMDPSTASAVPPLRTVAGAPPGT